MQWVTLLLLAATTAVTATSQTLFKRATGLIETPGNPGVGQFTRLIELLTYPSVIFALLIYAAAFAVWIYLLSKNSLSLLYPIGLSLNMVFGLIAARLFLGEAITTIHMLGVAVIITGIFIVAH